MTCVDYIQDDWLDQAHSKRIYSDLTLDYQDLLLLYALILEKSEKLENPAKALVFKKLSNTSFTKQRRVSSER